MSFSSATTSILRALAGGVATRVDATALERGLHALAEKPIALDAGKAREMVAEAESPKLVLVEGFHYLFHPMFARTQRTRRSGTVCGLGRSCPADLGRAPDVHWGECLGQARQTSPPIGSEVVLRIATLVLCLRLIEGTRRRDRS
jgi:predicted dehydrogenase